eukprot:1209947-Rhodomonas_salina.1
MQYFGRHFVVVQLKFDPRQIDLEKGSPRSAQEYPFIQLGQLLPTCVESSPMSTSTNSASTRAIFQCYVCQYKVNLFAPYPLPNLDLSHPQAEPCVFGRQKDSLWKEGPPEGAQRERWR